MNPFEVLEISPEASPEDIKAAYHRLAKQWHPDRFTGQEKEVAEEKFRELAEAFSQLKDPVRRASLQPALPKPQAPAPSARETGAHQERSADDWAAQAQEALKEGRLDQARALIHYAIRMDGSKAAYHALLGTILESSGGDLRPVVKALEAAVRLDPKDVDSHIKLAGHFEKLGMTARAKGHLQTAMELSPNHPKLRPFRPAPAPGSAAGSKKGATPPPQDLMFQLKDLWSRLTGRSRS